MLLTCKASTQGDVGAQEAKLRLEWCCYFEAEPTQQTQWVLVEGIQELSIIWTKDEVASWLSHRSPSVCTRRLSFVSQFKAKDVSWKTQVQVLGSL